MTAISLAQQIEEIDCRRRVYPGLVRAGKRRQSELDYHVARLEAALRTLKWVEEHAEEIKRACGVPRSVPMQEHGG
ncbi:MAG TPA: hypothetical protein VH684_30110 [Xanthobacteraceae bacterium]|jgi:hypothetical protein